MRKILRERFVQAIALGSLALVHACSREIEIVTPPGPLPVGAHMIVGPLSPVLTIGLTQQMLAVVAQADGEPLSDASVRWTSGDSNVASVTSLGLVTAHAIGTAALTALFRSLTTTARVTVQGTPVTSPVLLEHRDVVTTVFWVGESADASNAFISNAQSAFDASWLVHFGGIDAPAPRRGYLPGGFTPLENPFYFALPYNDFADNGARRHNAALVIPWAATRSFGTSESMVKNRWIRVTSRQTGRTCYAQWEDAGPGVYDDFQYVFGTSAPANPYALADVFVSSALDVSPAVRDCLGVAADVMRLDWQFVAEDDVPAGPWSEIVTRSQLAR